MKVSRLFISIIIIPICVSNAVSQFERQSQVEVSSGILLPLGPETNKNFYKMGYGIHGQYTTFISPTIAFSLGVGYVRYLIDYDVIIDNTIDNRYWFRDQSIRLNGMGALPRQPGVEYFCDANFSVIEINLGLRSYLTAPEANTQIFLFGMGTGNIIKRNYKVTLKTSLEFARFDTGYLFRYMDDNSIGFATGAGIEIPMTQAINIILQGSYRFIFASNETLRYIGITAGFIM